MSNIVSINNTIANAKQSFVGIIGDEKVFKKEANFAMQIIASNPFSTNMALSNPASLRNAVINLASTGLTLNPAQKLAYLVPRNKAIVLDISYMGLIHLAITDGAISWATAKIVYSNDDFMLTGLDTQPTHQYNPFYKKRGEIVGVYCVAKFPNGDYITDTMSIDEIKNIMNRSSGVKSGKSTPWSTDFEEMAKKTVIKRASKYWKGSSKLSTAIDILNNDNNEGIEFEKTIQKETKLDDISSIIDDFEDISEQKVLVKDK